MSLPDDYLSYPYRRYGYDHDRYSWSLMGQRAPLHWPDNKKLAVWINVSVQFFPLNQRGIPFKVPNGMTMPYPDLRHYSLRDYGNRVGIYRLLNAFEERGLQPSYALSAQLCELYPALVDRLVATGSEILCHGWNMDHLHYGGQDKEEEARQIQKALSVLRDSTGQKITGWLSPAKNQSENTPDLLAAEGIEYCCDWVNDDLPYAFQTSSGRLINLPLPTEIEDQFVLCNNLHTEDSWVEQVRDAIDFQLEEAKASQSGRLLGINLHPWLVGQPHRIACLEQLLDTLVQNQEIWHARPAELVAAFKAQAGGS